MSVTRRRPRIALATSANLDDLKTDDELLLAVLRGRGVVADRPIWDDPDVDWSQFDACLIRSTWDYHEKASAFLAWAREVEKATRLWNPAATVSWNVEKSYLRQLAQSGIPTVPTAWVQRGSSVDLNQLLSGFGQNEAVVKPTVDLGAINLSRVRDDAAGQLTLDRLLVAHDVMVQPYLPSLATKGELSIVLVNGEFSHAVRKLPAAGDFRVQALWGGTAVSAEPLRSEKNLARQVLDVMGGAGLPLYARVDLVEDLSGQPCLIELELIEPNLFLRSKPGAAEAFAEAILVRLDER